MAVFRMKDPATWLPVWAATKNLPALKVKVGEEEYTIPPDKQHGGFEITVADEASIRRFSVDPRWTRIS